MQPFQTQLKYASTKQKLSIDLKLLACCQQHILLSSAPHLWWKEKHAAHENLSWLKTWIGGIHNAVEDSHNSILSWILFRVVL